MESVVATVSGYHGSERFNLIRMITRAGANFVGTMSKSATHLVCWKFEGKKYDLARKFGTVVVNHRWVEDCIRRGRRVREGPYTHQSGAEVGPLSLGVQLSVQADASDKKHGVLSERARTRDGSKDDTIDNGVGRSDEGYRNISLNEDLFLEIRNGEKDNVRQNQKTRRSVRQDHGSSHRHFVQHEGPSSSVKHSEKGKRKIVECDRTSSPAKVSHKGRRLVKKNVQNDVVDLLSDSDQESCPTRVLGTEGLTDHSAHLVGLENVGHEDVEFENWNRVLTHKGSSNSTAKPPIITERAREGSSDAENTQRKIKDDDPIESSARIPSSVEVSCVICWTDFCSTRGILPCGHRFCYSCIQNWADHMVLRRKVSTCPLCKATFRSIKKLEDAATSDQKIYSQTVPLAPSTRDVFFLSDQDVTTSFGAQSSPGAVCSKCHQSEPEDCLVSCHICHFRRIHSYCLDPPLLPWTCIHCKDLQMLYLYNR